MYVCTSGWVTTEMGDYSQRWSVTTKEENSEFCITVGPVTRTVGVLA